MIQHQLPFFLLLFHFFIVSAFAAAGVSFNVFSFPFLFVLLLLCDNWHFCALLHNVFLHLFNLLHTSQMRFVWSQDQETLWLFVHHWQWALHCHYHPKIFSCFIAHHLMLKFWKWLFSNWSSKSTSNGFDPKFLECFWPIIKPIYRSVRSAPPLKASVPNTSFRMSWVKDPPARAKTRDQRANGIGAEDSLLFLIRCSTRKRSTSLASIRWYSSQNKRLGSQLYWYLWVAIFSLGNACKIWFKASCSNGLS